MRADSEQSKRISIQEIRKNRWPLYALAAAVLLNLMYYGLMRHSATEQFEQIGIAVTKEASQGIKIWVSEQRKVASLVANGAPVSEWLKKPVNDTAAAEVTRYLRSVISRFNQFEEIRIERFRNPGHPWANASDGTFKLDSYSVSSQGVTQEKDDYKGTLEAILDGKSYYISSIQRSAESGKPVFYFSIPLFLNNETAAVMTFTVKISFATDALINPIEYRQTGYLFMIDDRGETIAHKNASYVLSDEQYLVDVVNALMIPLKTGENKFKGKFQDDWKFYYGVPSGLDPEFSRNQWYVVFTQKEKEIYSEANRFLAVATLTSVGLIFCLILYIYRLEDYKSKMYIASNERLEKELLEEKLKQKTNEMVKQFSMDQLTGLGHFQSIQRYLEQLINEMAHSERVLTLCLFHVDKLSEFNEREGYAIGDIVLNLIGKLLKDRFEPDCVTGRLYGDVFAIVFKDKTLIESLILIEQFRNLYEGHEMALVPQKPSLSFGVVQWQGEKAGQMLNQAEYLLEKCKREGQRQIKY